MCWTTLKSVNKKGTFQIESFNFRWPIFGRNFPFLVKTKIFSESIRTSVYQLQPFWEYRSDGGNKNWTLVTCKGVWKHLYIGNKKWVRNHCKWNWPWTYIFKKTIDVFWKSLALIFFCKILNMQHIICYTVCQIYTEKH